jgi:histidinol phosphatase-like enzyme
MIGDSMSDIEFANNLKINSILLSEQKIDSKSFLSATSWFEIMDIVEIS